MKYFSISDQAQNSSDLKYHHFCYGYLHGEISMDVVFFVFCFFNLSKLSLFVLEKENTGTIHHFDDYLS